MVISQTHPHTQRHLESGWGHGIVMSSGPLLEVLMFPLVFIMKMRIHALSHNSPRVGKLTLGPRL